MMSSLLIISFMNHAFGSASKKSSPYPLHLEILLYSRSSIVLHFAFNYIIHCLLISVKGVGLCLDFFFPPWISICFSTFCWKDYLSSIAFPLLFYQSTFEYIWVGLFFSSLFSFIDLFVLSLLPHCLDFCS